MTSGADREGQIAWLRLARAQSVGPATFAHLIARFGSAARALEALPDLARRGGREAAPRIPSRADVERTLDRAAAVGARLLLASDAAFPRLLARTDGGPTHLWALGDVAHLTRDSVAIVGARSASAAGRRFARELATGLGEAGLVVVSGLARGVDAAAHVGALETGTVAVLAGGVDEPYPAENTPLHRQIAARGCIVSERAMGHVARAADFPRRNRIISGLALGTVVVEAELRSGSLITARLAAEQGREVFAVPGSPYEPRARGTNELIRQGATLVESAEDVLAVLGGLPRTTVANQVDEAAPRALDDVDDLDLDGLAERLDELLSPTPVSLDELARASGAPISQVTAALVEMSLAGRAELAPGGYAHRA
jgi:DNA processing protein